MKAPLESFGLGICSDCKEKAPLFRAGSAALCRFCHPQGLGHEE